MRKSLIASCLLPAAMLSMQASAVSGETVLDVDFSKSMKAQHVKAKGSFDGVLPEGCAADFPGWNASSASSKALSEDGRQFLRLEILKVDSAVQFNFPLKGLQVPGCYKLAISCRAPSSELGLGVRQLPSPYKSFWTASIPAGDSLWKEKVFVINLDEKSDAPLGLFLYPGTGNVDISSLRLVKLNAAETAELVQRPPKDCANYFRNSRFPLGLQAGWNVSRDFSGGSVEAGISSPGPSGFPSLKIQFDKPCSLYSEPFQTAQPLQRNFVSFAAKGSGEWKVSVFHQNSSGRPRDIAAKSFKATGEWQTQVVEFKLDEQASSARAFSIKIAGSGSLSLDSLQAWSGSPERQYVSQGACEVALAFPQSSSSEARIQFADEEPAVDYCVSGSFEGAVLKLKAFNVFGEERELPSIALGRSLLGKIVGASASNSESGSFLYDAFKSASLGQFRIEAWVERDGKRISPFNEILMTRLNRPVHFDSDAPDSPFGCHFQASPLTMRMMKAAGVNWARLHDAGTDYIGWYHLEPEQGLWSFRDDAIKLYRDNHIKIFAGLQTAPVWASVYKDAGKKDFNGYFDRYFQPKDMAAWSNYAKTVASRYKGVIDDFFIWNEPWGASFWHSGYDAVKKEYTQGLTPEADFAKISIAAWTAVKEANPSASVSGFNSMEGEKGRSWTKGVYDAGAYQACDAVDYHFYTPKDQGFFGDQAHKAYEDAIGYIKEMNPKFDKPVIMSEGQGNSTGGAGGGGFGLYKRALPWAADEGSILSGDKTCRFVIANLASGCSRVFLYSAHCYTGLAVEPNFVALVGPDGYPQAELAAFSNMAWRLEGRKFVRMVKLNESCCAFIFEGRGSSVAVVSGLRSGVFEIPPSLAVSDLFGNPVKGKAVYKGFLLYVDSKLGADALQEALLSKQF